MVAVKKSAKPIEAEDGEIFSASSFSSLGLHSNLCDQLQGDSISYFHNQKFNLYFEKLIHFVVVERNREVGLQSSDSGSSSSHPGNSLRPPRACECGDGDRQDGGVFGSGYPPPEFTPASNSTLRWYFRAGSCADARAVSAGS